MGIRENLRMAILAFKEANNLTLSETADALGISRSTLQEYLAGKINPRADTLEYLAEKLGTDPALLLSTAFESKQVRLIQMIFHYMPFFAELPQENKVRLSELLCEAVELMSPETV